MRLPDDPVANPVVQPTGDDRFEQCPGLVVGQAANRELRQSRQLHAGIALGKDDGKRISAQAPGYEGERLHGGEVQPLGVVYHAESAVARWRRQPGESASQAPPETDRETRPR